MRFELATMRRALAVLRRLLADKRAVTSLEYGLIAAVMVTAIATTIRSVSAPISTAFCNIYISFGGAC